jgi:drug/metabolite transporter (DMT)-like permease
MGTAEIAAGLACGIAAAACFELGYVIQAGDARAAGEHAGGGLLLRLARRRAWLGGTALVVCGLALQLLALYLAPLSVVQPALVLGLGLLLVLAERRLGERPGLRGWLAVAAAAAGVLLLALGGEGAGGTGGGGHPVVVLSALAAVVLAAQGVGRLARLPGAFVLAAGLGEAWAVIGAKVALDDVADGALVAAVAWGVAAGAMGLLALDAEMTGLQRVPASVVGPMVLILQSALPVALAPAAVGEDWTSPPAVVAGLILVAAAAAVLAGQREQTQATAARGA